MAEISFHHTIDKYGIITDILTAFDLLEGYKREAEALKRDMQTLSAMTSNGNDGEVNPFDLLCLSEGCKAIFERCTYSWRSVSATRNEETGAIEVTTFERYRESTFNRCPDSMSKRDFFEYFDGEFRRDYEEEKAKAIEQLEEEEASDDE